MSSVKVRNCLLLSTEIPGGALGPGRILAIAFARSLIWASLTVAAFRYFEKVMMDLLVSTPRHSLHLKLILVLCFGVSCRTLLALTPWM